MGPRIARSSVLATVKNTTRNKNKKRSLDAYAQAQTLVPERRIPQHRLGEDLDDEAGQKRRRDDNDEDENEKEEEGSRRKRPVNRSIAARDDDVEYGSDSEGNEWTMGGIAEHQDDSDLDSDEAFGESDEERFQGFAFRGSSAGKTKTKTKKRKQISNHNSRGHSIDLNEQEQNEEDPGDSEDDEGLGLGNEAVDLAAILDEDDDDLLGGKDTTGPDMGEESAGEEGEEDEEDEEDSSESDFEEEDDGDAANEEAAARMRDRLEALDSTTRSPPVHESSVTATLDDFLEGTGLAPEKPLYKSKKKQPKTTAIAAPLPKRQQDRLDREVASEKAEQELQKWLPGTKQIRRAEHLSFPLQHPDDQGVTLGREKFTPSTQHAPQTELEESIQRIMEESGLVAKQTQQDGEDVGDEEVALLKAEDLAVRELPVEEVMQRRAELRRARELLFREEIKAKRLAKIKSKSHRRVMRRQKERERQALEALSEDEMDDDDKERADRTRAEARMSTKHRDSKWAKSLKQTNRTSWDDDAKDGVLEQVRRKEELRKRIEGKNVSDEGTDLPSDEVDSDDEDILHTKLDDLKASGRGLEKGLAGLKFMRAADERRRKANDEDVDRLRKELAVADGDEDESDVEEENLGRAIFGPQRKEARTVAEKTDRLDFEAPEDSENEEQDKDGEEEADITTERLQPHGNVEPKSKGVLKESNISSRPIAENWLREPENTPNAWLQAPKTRLNKADVNADVNLNVSAPAKVPSKAGVGYDAQAGFVSTPNNIDGWTKVPYNADSDSEFEPSDPIVSTKKEKKTLQQRAFAGDDVHAAFEAEKAGLVASEDEKEISTHLPGWGSWTGDGLSKSIRKANQLAKHNPLFKTKIDGVKQADRKDANLKNVIISEKQDRKGKKYLASILPHEFETKEQYERSRRVPMGPEWTTKEVHQKMTKPRVVVKPGVNIKPLERPIA